MDKILASIIKYAETGDLGACKDAVAYLRGKKDINDVRAVRTVFENLAKTHYTSDLEYLYKMTYYVAAPFDFDSYMLYMECDRKPHERFWKPRRKKLYKAAQALQMLNDNKLDELFLSCPPRIGKSTLALFFTTWVMGNQTEYPKLYCSYSDTITTAFYNGILEILTDNHTYKFQEVFPAAKIVATNAKEETVDLERAKRYKSLTARSLYGTLNGACDADKGYIIADDLIGGIEEALNKDRLDSAWSKVDNNLIPRGKETTKHLWIGTRWSIYDPTGRRMALLENDEKFKDRRWAIINMPALDENDESNFEYEYGVGFSTDYYKQRRASFEYNNDIASWEAQYQNTPIEREGTVFAPADMRYYNGELPEGDPDRVFMVVDPSWGGGDYVSGPVCVQFGDDIYVPNVVFDKSEKTVTQPKIANLVRDYGVKAMKVEGTKMTASFGEEVDAILKKMGIRVNMQINTKHFTGTGKEQRIFDHAPSIRGHFIFLQQGKRPKEYELFMQNVFSFKIEGKNKNDDAPDSLAMADDFAFYSTETVAVVGRRPF